MFELLRDAWKELTTPSGSSTEAPMRSFNWWMLLLSLVSAVVIVILEINGGKYYDPYRWLYYLLPGLFLMLALNGPVIRVARSKRDRAIHVVLIWGFIGIVSFIITFVASFAAFTEITASSTAAAAQSSGLSAPTYDRLLNIVPAVIAVWIAGLGWYWQHQIAMKGHRTTHAFNLIMQTRTNSEYVNQLRAFQLLYPVEVPIPSGDMNIYRGQVANLAGLQRRVKDDPRVDIADKLEIAETIEKIEAINAAKYLLNYYEFMARGIQSGDLDEGVLYDTIGTSVIGIFTPTKEFRSAFHHQQPLAMCFLAPLVDRWERQKRLDAASLSA